MIIIGAKGFAKEVLEVIFQQNPDSAPIFYDDVNTDLPDKLFDRYLIYKSVESAREHFAQFSDKSFTLGLGGPLLRFKLYEKFSGLGGTPVTLISPFAQVGHFGNEIGDGCNIMTGTVITNDITIGKGCLINLNCTIGHDSKIGDFVEMSPNVNISGNCTIGNFVSLGTNATVLPGVKIGDYAVIGAGSVVTKDIPANVMAYGVPAQVIKTIDRKL